MLTKGKIVYWKLNNSDLSDEMINEIKNEENSNPIVKWEFFKSRAREFSINFSRNLRNILNKEYHHCKKNRRHKKGHGLNGCKRVKIFYHIF